MQLVTDLREKLFSDQTDAIMKLLPVQFGLLVAYIAFKNATVATVVETATQNIEKSSSGLTKEINRLLTTQSDVRTIRRDDFYREFGEDLKRARNAVAITHLAGC